MRMLKKSFMSACVALALVLMLPSMNVCASSDTDAGKSTYTVTFRPGKVGYFAKEKTPEGNIQELAKEVARGQYKNYEVTPLGAIKVTVNAGDPIPSAPAHIQVEDGYFEKGGWASTELEKVERNMDFVVDYGKLINGVEYTVKYVDSVGDSIAPSKIAQANAGEPMTAYAPSQIIVSGATVYNLSSDASITRTLSEDASANVFTFEYTLAPVGTVIEEVIIGEDGEIITLEEYVTTTVGGGQAGGAVAGGAADGGAAGGAAEGGEVAEGGNEAVEILDEETPLAGGIDEATNEEPAGMVEIGEEEVPLASGEEPMANMALIGASIFGAGAVLLAGAWLFMKKKRAAVTNTTEE